MTSPTRRLLATSLLALAPLVAAAQEMVVDGSAAAVHDPSALKLVGGGGATPIETLGELDVCHEHLLCIVGR